MLATRSQRRCPLASTVEIAARTEADLPLLFGLAKVAFVDLPGWSDERVLEVLRRDLTFVAREQGQPAGYVALRRMEGGPILIEQLLNGGSVGMLAEQVDYVIGVDTHRDRHTLAVVVAPTGAVLAQTVVRAMSG